jgi:hypothetical protein
MGGVLRSLLVTGIATVAVALGLPATSAFAAPATSPNPTAADSTVGYDVSHPQCGSTLPGDRAFGVVGVNGGLATIANPCLAAQLQWAARSSGAVSTQPPAQLYLNTANPGEIRDLVTTWPSDGDTPYGTCDGRNSTACSWQYGWERARTSVTSFFLPAAQSAGADDDPGHYGWWLDVEAANTWQSASPAGQSRNRAALEGMAAYVIARGGSVGLYAVPAEWRQLAGTVTWDSNLYRLDTWLPGATTSSGATANCRRPALTNGSRVTLAQFVSGGLDRNVSCV